MLQQTILHTYVGSSCGAAWGCGGGATGGTSVCSGNGSSIEADCIDGKDDAGILYLLTGVCHQSANRILSAANSKIPMTYSQVRQSCLTYTDYGRNIPGVPRLKRWPDRKQSCAPPAGGAGSLKLSLKVDIQFSVRSSGLTNANFRKDGNNGKRSKLSALVRAGLGHSVDRTIVDGLATMQSQLQARQGELAQLVMTNKISRSAYVSKLDEAFEQAEAAGEDLLGFDDFHKVFGEFRVHNLGDVSTFLNGRLADRKVESD